MFQSPNRKFNLTLVHDSFVSSQQSGDKACQAPPRLPGPARGLGAGAGLGRGWLELCEWLLSGELDWSWGDEISRPSADCLWWCLLTVRRSRGMSKHENDGQLPFFCSHHDHSLQIQMRRPRGSIVSIVSCHAAAGKESKVSLILGWFYIFTLFG